METIIVPVNRTKTTIALVTAFFIFLYGAYLAFIVANDERSHFDPLAMAIVGYCLMGLFGLAVALGVKRLVKYKDALILTDAGFECPLLDPDLGLIPWDNVYRVEVDSVMAINKALFIFVNDAQQYIDQSSGWRKRTLKNQYKAYGTPFTIMMVNLKIKPNDLDRIVRERWKARQAAIAEVQPAGDENA